MGVMVSDDGLRDTKPSDDMIEYEKCCSFPGVIECRHRLGPLSEIIHSYNDVSISLGRVRVTFHEFNSPFRKWTNRKYRIERSRMRSNLMIIGLTSMALLNYENAILEKRNPEVTSS
jgi:hypothetical protein